MDRHGFTLVEIMIVVAIIALLAAIGIPGLLRARQIAAEAAAASSLKSIATALEVYAGANTGNYTPGGPVTNLAHLTSATPPYLGSDYCNTTMQSYSYDCSSARTGYTITATPNGIINAPTYTITTGAVLTSQGG